jgi:metal-dependent amidase/aminoacylase/carboxypeptidase family protein
MKKIRHFSSFTKQFNICLLSLSLVFVIICQQKAISQQSINADLSHELIKLETDKIFDKLVKIRRDFHENPELAGGEIRTQEIVKHYLLGLGLEVETNIYGRSVVGILKGGKEGRKIAWRADMDALPHDFPDDVDFKSRVKGVQHGCGHDIHLAIALGIAEVLSKNKAPLHGTVYFIFQPEEETFRGAKNMLDSGLLSKINPDEIYGFHITALPVGQIMVKPNEIFAYQKRISIKLKNELNNEQAKQLTKDIYSLLSRAKTGSKPWELQNMVDPQLGVTNPNTIFQDYLIMDENFAIYDKNGELFLETYLYETNAANLETIIPKIKQLIEASTYKKQLLSISFIQENPTVNNDAQLTNMAIKTLDSIYGTGFVVKDYGQVPFFNDDFAYFQQKIRGVYFLLGGSNFEKGIIAMNHAPNFKVDETCIKTGVKCFSSLIVERLK